MSNLHQIYVSKNGNLLNFFYNITFIFFLLLFSSIITANIRYTDLVSTLPSQTKVLLWPVHPSKKLISSSNGTGGNQYHHSLSRLSYAEDALKTLSLPEAYAEIVLNLPQAIKQIYPSLLG